MEIVIGKTAGFCFGVENAVTKAEEELEKTERVYCLGELVHNKQVIEELIEKGIIFVEDLDTVNGKLIIRSHGVSKEVYEKAKKKGIELVDLTCPKVLKIHSIAQEYANNGYYIFLVGQSKHAETIGTVSYCGDHFSIIEEIEDIKTEIEKCYQSNKKDIVVICQTTFNLKKFKDIVSKMEKELSSKNLKIINTICNATAERQEETIEISKQVELMIIIGSKHSSNTSKLYEISQNYCENVILIETKDEIDLTGISKFGRIGIMAGASTPQKSINEVVEIIKQV